MTPYQAGCWCLCLTTSVLLIAVIWRERFLLVKPSVILLVFFHVQIQWAATVESGTIEARLKDPVSFAALAHGFPLLGLLGAYVTARGGARRVWTRLMSRDVAALLPARWTIPVLASAVGLTVAWYLAVVPFTSTGLYALLVEPATADLVREQSWKLLPDAGIRYGYSLLVAVLGPLLASAVGVRLVRDVRARRWGAVAAEGLMIAGTMLSVTLPGTRLAPARIVVVVLLTVFVLKGLPVRPRNWILYAAAAAGVLLIPLAMSIQRTRGDTPLTESYVGMYAVAMFERTFEVPMKTGLWYVDYVQRNGYFGIAGVEKLALLFGKAPVDVPNVIGLHEMGTRIESVSAVTCYVFAYHSYFGLASLAISLAALWLLDLAVWVYAALSDRMLVPCVVTVSVAGLSLLATEYTTALVTHGFAVTLLLALGLDGLRPGAPRAAGDASPRPAAMPPGAGVRGAPA